MLKRFLTSVVLALITVSVFAQTPYDAFAPEQSVKPINELVSNNYVIFNTDSTANLQLIVIDWKLSSYTLYDKDSEIICSGRLSENDRKFLSMDLLAEDTPSISPYVFCLGNPVNYTDPTGLSTNVVLNDDGTYSVIGGDLTDDDLNIYMCVNVNGETRRLWSIGTTPVISSFYNSDANNGQGAWMIGAVINPNDSSGIDFIRNIISNTPNNLDYALNAYGSQIYDYKVSNGTSSPDDDYHKAIDYYRGVTMGTTSDGMPIYTSARDLGNIAAGFVTGFNGLPWSWCRVGFDGLQSIQEGRRATEGFSSQNAQKYGHNLGLNRLKQHMNNSVPNVFPYSLFRR